MLDSVVNEIGRVFGEVDLSTSDRVNELPFHGHALIVQVRGGYVGVIPPQKSFVEADGNLERVVYRPVKGDRVHVKASMPLFKEEVVWENPDGTVDKSDVNFYPISLTVLDP